MSVTSSPDRFFSYNTPRIAAEQHLVMLPIEDNQEVYTFQADDLSQFTLQFDVLPAFGSKQSELIGRAIVLPTAFADLKGVLNCAIIDSELSVVGELSFEYLVVKPLNQPPPSATKTYWKATKVCSG